ncbi:cache domain-containing protein [Rhizobium terrae]|uniref:cache domain-containing protein n=1 Tax=Rhizobium terrae TaxID=2171756 RepID=UPI0013C36209|nr:cache domain-containing protein [Rhizobium terrae]
MTFRTSAPTAIVAAIVVVVLATIYFSMRLFSGMVNDVEVQQFTLIRSLVQTAIIDAENKALARAELIADLPRVQQLFAAQDRAGLTAELGRMLANQKNRHGVDQAQFHLAPAMSFLRLHDLSRFGDDLTATRPMVVALNRDRVPLKSPAIAANGPGIFGGTPVFDAGGRHLGSFEVGIAFGPLMAGLKSAYNLDLGLFVEERPLRDFAKGVDPERLGDQNRFGKYIRFESTNGALISAVTTPEDLAAVTEPVTYVREVDGVVRGVVLVPINNTAGTPLGVIAATADFSASRAGANRTLIWQAAFALIGIVLLSGFVIAILRGFVVRPLEVLSKSFEGVSKGGSLAEIEGADHFPAEMQPIVQVYGRLRAHRNAAATKG